MAECDNSPMNIVLEDPITKIIQEQLVVANSKLDRLNDVEKKLSSVNPKYLSEMERNLKQKDQLLECRIGPASKLKEIILAGVQTHDQLQIFINNNEQKLIENEKVSDCLEKKLIDFKLNVEKEKKYLELIEKLLQ